MDFYKIKTRPGKRKGEIEIYPDFQVGKKKDLMVRGRAFYAIWDDAAGMWSQNDYDVQRIIDADLSEALRKETESAGPDIQFKVKYVSNFSSSTWREFQNYVKTLPDNYHQLDESITFLSDPVKRTDYVSHRVSYDPENVPTPAYDEMMTTLYAQPEREKFEWAIGSILCGESKDIQKFIVFYGGHGTGKSTVIDIIEQLFDGYTGSFEAKALGSSNATFALEPFKENPLVAIDPEAKLDRIEDNTRINSIVGHDILTMNEKFKSAYPLKINSFLFMATNSPVKITDAKSGIIRRLINVSPTGHTFPPERYFQLKEQISFELGGIARHCMNVYERLGKNYYNNYRPTEMMYKTDMFFNFVEDSSLVFQEQDGVALKVAYTMYKTYCDESEAEFKLPMYKFREELKNYFRDFQEVARVDGKQVRSWYSGFLVEKLRNGAPVEKKPIDILVLDSEDGSAFEAACFGCPAQYATKKEIPEKPWAEVTTHLSDLDTHRLHYVQVPENMIVIDFDLRDDQGNKDAAKNLEAAAKWPPTYAEFSKSGAGVHLHYYYDGDVSKLNCIHEPGIEVKVFKGNSSLRRKLIRCNRLPIAHISSGLKLKEEKVVSSTTIQNVEHLIALVGKALRKEIPPGSTKTSVDFIKMKLDEAYASGMKYDLTPMKHSVAVFAAGSTHHSLDCLKLVDQMHFKSDDQEPSVDANKDQLVFFDVEVFPNLLLVNWKFAGEGKTVVRMINPSPNDISDLLEYKLVGFNCRRYDNHILYARLIGWSIEQIYELSQRIVAGSKNAMFGDAYNLSYADVYDFSSKKQSLKKFEIELGIHHQELGLPWDKPVAEELWPTVAEYCDNDVIATEAVFNDRAADFTARKILAAVAGMTVNDTTNQLTTKIIFGNDSNPSGQFNYRFMGQMEDHETYSMPIEDDPEALFGPNGLPIFRGYTFDNGKSIYRGEEVGEGGYVYSEPGMYRNVALLDIASMHPSSIVAEELFGPKYTQRFKDIMEARIAAKHFDREKAGKLLDGKLLPYMDTEEDSQNLAAALKIAINSVYGLTAAKFSNPFHDPRNRDNIVAKRGSLFMVNLKNYVQKLGYKVAHIKTDSIKIPDADDYIIDKVQKYGAVYGYTFEHEATYDRMCLVNDAVYIAKYDAFGIRNKGGKHANEWTATGAQFQHPYVFKTLFSHEPLEFSDMCETKTVSTSIWLNIDGNRRFIGKAGCFCPVTEGGGTLERARDEKDGTVTYHSATGAKGYMWQEAEIVKKLHMEGAIDRRYFDKLANDAKAAVVKYTDWDAFVD